MVDEMIDIYDKHNNPLGLQKMKSEAHEKGLWHRGAHIWVYNSKGELLLQLRANDKQFFPDCWDISAAGHVAAGEEPLVSALRELEEEVGISAEPEELEFFGIHKEEHILHDGTFCNNEYCYTYILRYEGSFESLEMQKEEVQGLRFIDIDLLEKDLVKNPERYVPHKHWAEVLNKIKLSL